MLRFFTDFHAVTHDGGCFILWHDETNINESAHKLDLSKGAKVILDAHEDFEVTGTLDFKFVDVLNREVWIAYPDWSTRADK